MNPPISAKGKDVPERITRAILAAKSQWDIDHPDHPNGFTLSRAIEAARTQWRLERPARTLGSRDPIFDALVIACGGDLQALTRQYAATVATAKRDILEATPNVTPDEIMRRATRYLAKYKDAACTPLALAKHWPEFPMVNNGSRKPDVYKEPVGWQDALSRLAERSRWNRETVQLMLSAPWQEIDLGIRAMMLKEIERSGASA